VGDDEGNRNRQLMLAEKLTDRDINRDIGQKEAGEIRKRSVILGCHRTNYSETRELLIQAIGEVDREIEVYIPRMAFQDLIHSFEDFANTKESLWKRLIKIFAKLMFVILELLGKFALTFAKSTNAQI
jgi:hypothetical protein